MISKLRTFGKLLVDVGEFAQAMADSLDEWSSWGWEDFEAWRLRNEPESHHWWGPGALN